MPISKVIEVQAEGDTVEAAVEAALDGASRSVRNFEAVVEGGAVSHYRVDTKITFLLDGGEDAS